MPKPTANTVTYEQDNVNGNFIVQRVPNIRILSHAVGPIRELIRHSYINSYEEPNGPLPKGTVDARYAPIHHTDFFNRAAEHFRNGSQYWIALSEGSGGWNRMLGFAKTSPNYPSKGTFYLNDVVVDPSSQRRGYGTMLVHAALKYGGYDDKPLQLEAYELNEGEGKPNQMYQNMGLVRVGEAEPFEFPNRSQLDMCLYSTPQDVTVAGVVQALEARYEHLRTGFASKVSILANT